MPPKKRGTRATKRKAEPVDEQPLEGENVQDEVSLGFLRFFLQAFVEHLSANLWPVTRILLVNR